MSLESIKQVLGAKGFIDAPGEMAAYLEEPRERWTGKAALVARPKSTEEVSAVVALCHQQGIGIVPQGGHTGLWGGAMPDETGSQIILSLARLNKLRSLDPAEFTVTVEAGCILANIQTAAAESDCLFPLSLAAEGSCQIGGNIATDAGGINVLQYGTARDLVLGLEVVLPDGEIWNGLRALHKDNTGYDLKHLFIGAEGTLGVITAAVCKLFPAPKQKATALVALADLDASIKLYRSARTDSGDRITSFELIPRIGLDFVTSHMPGCNDPMAEPSEWYALIELSTPETTIDLSERLQSLLADALETGLLSDVVIAASEAQAAGLWRLREFLSEAQKFEGGSLKHDIAVPIGSAPSFIRDATAAVEKAAPGVRPVPFGHIGDGNIHFNLSQPVGTDREAFLSRRDEIGTIVNDIVAAYGGSFSAEHGIGKARLDDLLRYKSPVEIDLMRKIKRALDPKNIMNPGKVVPGLKPRKS